MNGVKYGNVVKTDDASNLYYAHTDSRLRYGVCFWGISSLSHGVFLEQKRIIWKGVRTDHRYTCRSAFKTLRILILKSLILEFYEYMFSEIEICLLFILLIHNPKKNGTHPTSG